MIHVKHGSALSSDSTQDPSQELRDEIATLRETLAASNRDVKELSATRKWQEAFEKAAKSQRLASELNMLLAEVDQYELGVGMPFGVKRPVPSGNRIWTLSTSSIARAVRSRQTSATTARGRRRQINAWVENQTNKRIKDLVPNGAVDDLTRLVLTNAIYFKGDWGEPFVESATSEDDFSIAAGTRVRVPMMHKYGMSVARYAAFNADGTFFPTPVEVPINQKPDPQTLYPGKGGFVAVELPYKGGDLSMVVIMPQDADGLAELEKKISGGNLQTWISKLQGRRVNVHLLKFKLETAYRMKDTLSTMGMVRIFVDPSLPNSAQFDGIFVSRDPSSKPFISEVLHKAFVEVTEKGTEAAAATSLVAVAAAVHPTAPFTPTFRTDRPFEFLIRDTKSGSILFWAE